MKFLQKLFGNRRPTTHHDVTVPACVSRYGDGCELDLYYSTPRENRPYVIAMREVAADCLLSSTG